MQAEGSLVSEKEEREPVKNPTGMKAKLRIYGTRFCTIAKTGSDGPRITSLLFKKREQQ
jgi:hypothetical protein